MQPSRTSRRQIIVLDGSEVVQGSDNSRTSSRQSSARTGQLQQGSDNAPATRTGSDNPGSDNPRVARQGTRATGQGSDNQDRVRQPACCQIRDKSHRARLGQTPRTRQPNSCRDRVRQPASCQSSKDQRIEHGRTSACTGRSRRS